MMSMMIWRHAGLVIQKGLQISQHVRGSTFVHSHPTRVHELLNVLLEQMHSFLEAFSLDTTLVQRVFNSLPQEAEGTIVSLQYKKRT